MPPQIATTPIPASIVNIGKVYHWSDAPVVGLNGRGLAVEAGYPGLLWTWDWMEDAGWNFWYTTICGGAASVLISSGTTQLYDVTKTLITISSCVIYRPRYKRLRYGIYEGVELNIGQIVGA